MGAKNKYFANNVPALFRRTLLDQAIYVFIDTQKFTIPSISIEESAKAFLTHYKISEDEYSHAAVVKSYLRTRKDLYNEERTKED